MAGGSPEDAGGVGAGPDRGRAWGEKASNDVRGEDLERRQDVMSRVDGSLPRRGPVRASVAGGVNDVIGRRRAGGVGTPGRSVGVGQHREGTKGAPKEPLFPIGVPPLTPNAVSLDALDPSRVRGSPWAAARHGPIQPSPYSLTPYGVPHPERRSTPPPERRVERTSPFTPFDAPSPEESSGRRIGTDRILPILGILISDAEDSPRVLGSTPPIATLVSTAPRFAVPRHASAQSCAVARHVTPPRASIAPPQRPA